MFGYIKPFKPELRIKEFEMYRAYYCSMCKSLGKSYGIFARFTLNYEFVFLAMLAASLKDETCETAQKRCPFNPLKKCNFCKNQVDEFDFAASAAMLLLYYKLLDNLRDEKGIKALKYLSIKPMLKSSYKKAKAKYPQLDKLFSEYDEAQQKIESAGILDIDRASEPTAKMLGELFKMCSANENNKLALDRLGYCMGRYIYILDAAADIEKDIKTNSYNPLKSRADALDLAKRQLYFSINEAKSAFELLKIYKFKNILGNIICLGLEDAFNKELKI